VSKARDIGTAAETGFVDLLKKSGWPTAERRTLSGRFDKGDVSCGHPELCFEVKGGKNYRIPEWLRETETERVNAGAVWGFLIVKAKGVGYPNAGKWWAISTKDQWDTFQEIHKNALAGTALEYLNTTVRKHTIPQAMMQAQATRSARMEMEGIEGWEALQWYTGVWFTGWGNCEDYFVTRVDFLLDMLIRCGFATDQGGAK